MKKNSGFTLIELMIAVAIVGILVKIALPSYSSYVQYSRRVEAINGLLDAASREARFYTTQNIYTIDITQLGFVGYPSGSTTQFAVPSSTNALYTVSIARTAGTTTTPESFTATATVVAGSSQANDECGNFTYSDLGVRGISGINTIAKCWGQ